MPTYTTPHMIEYPTATDLLKSSTSQSALADDFKALADTAQAALTQEAQKLGTALYYRGTLPTGTDLNTLSSRTNNGIWDLPGSNTHTSAPFTGAGKVTISIGGIGAGEQRAVKYGSYAEWVRGISNAYSTPIRWTEWSPVQLKPENRGILPDSADLNQYHLVSAHHGTWATSSAYLETYADWPFPNEQGVLQVIAGGNGAATQVAYPYARNVGKRRVLTSITDHTWTLWADIGDGPSTGPSTGSYSQATDPGAPLESLATALTMWGDSLTHAGGVASRIAQLMPGVTVTNRGVSGQTASQIAGRQGAYNSLITVTGNSIPASGPVSVTARSITILAQTGYRARSEPGRLAGVNGTLSNAEGSIAYTFTRTTSGDAVECPPGTPFIADQGKAARRDMQIIWAGTNNPGTGIVEYVMGMCRHLSPALKKFLVLSATGNSSDGIGTDRHKLYTVASDQLSYELGDRFYDLRRWLIDSGLAAAGITPTAEDDQAVANDAIPPSLTVDGTHFTASVQTIIGDQVHARLVALGWA